MDWCVSAFFACEIDETHHLQFPMDCLSLRTQFITFCVFRNDILIKPIENCNVKQKRNYRKN